MTKQSYRWKAVDQDGTLKQGVSPANDKNEIQAYLKKEGYLPVRIQAIGNWRRPGWKPAGKPHWSFFARQLGILVESGIPLLQALEIMTFHGEKLSWEQELWQSLKERVEAGSDLSEALSLLESSPNSFVISMLKAGEHTGTLGKALNEVAEELDQEQMLHKKVKAALAYPLLLSLGIVIVLYVLSVWVLPMYEKLFLSMDSTELPLLTKVIFEAGRKLPVLLGSVLALGILILVFVKVSKRDQWKLFLERIFLGLPILGKVYRLRDLVQFSRTLGGLTAAGIPLLEGLRLTAGTLRSSELQELTNRLVVTVRQGKRMAPLLRTSRSFPKEGAEMIAIAEETGQLERMLNCLNQLFRRELEAYLEKLLRMLEPLLILAIAGVIGLVASGVMIPIFDLSSHLK